MGDINNLSGAFKGKFDQMQEENPEAAAELKGFFDTLASTSEEFNKLFDNISLDNLATPLTEAEIEEIEKEFNPTTVLMEGSSYARKFHSYIQQCFDNANSLYFQCKVAEKQEALDSAASGLLQHPEIANKLKKSSETEVPRDIDELHLRYEPENSTHQLHSM